MKKIPTLFVRGDNHLVIDELIAGTEWVRNGEGVATRKWDGTCARIKDGVLYKRYDIKKGRVTPYGFEPAQDPDPITGHWPGWVEVGNGKEDKWFKEGLENESKIAFVDGTYELCGPKINGNPEGFVSHVLIKHGDGQFDDCPRTFFEIEVWLKNKNIEGIVWHHPDGRMAKIKKKDFGMKREAK